MIKGIRVTARHRGVCTGTERSIQGFPSTLIKCQVGSLTYSGNPPYSGKEQYPFKGHEVFQLSHSGSLSFPSFDDDFLLRSLPRQV